MGLHPVILAGGSGTRLWPLSREQYPKQFLQITSRRSMLQETIARTHGIKDVASPVVICNEEHRFLVAEHLRQLGISPSPIILESVSRNTAPALTLGALHLEQGCQHCDSNDPVMVVMPADHNIEDIPAFQNSLQLAECLASNGCIVTFGISPTTPKTAYGYLEKGQTYNSMLVCRKNDRDDALRGINAFQLTSFIEKPEEKLAKEMIKTGRYLWNSGIFVMKASIWLRELAENRPEISEICRAAYSNGSNDGDFFRPNRQIFDDCPSDSIDYAVMENTPLDSFNQDKMKNVERIVIPIDIGWSDVGSWNEYWDKGIKSSGGNVLKGDIYVEDTKDSLLISQERMIAAVGLENIVVVETADAILVADKGRLQGLKDLVGRLKQDRREEQINHRKVHRPWGSYETVVIGERFQVKRLEVKPGGGLSLQLHHHRAEHWVVVKGTAKVTRGEEEFLLTEHESTYVPVGTKHRLENPGTIPLEIIEVQSGSYLGEDDIVRLEDYYSREVPRVMLDPFFNETIFNRE